MPTRLRQLDIPRDDLRDIANETVKNFNANAGKRSPQEQIDDAMRLLEAAYLIPARILGHCEKQNDEAISFKGRTIVRALHEKDCFVALRSSHDRGVTRQGRDASGEREPGAGAAMPLSTSPATARSPRSPPPRSP